MSKRSLLIKVAGTVVALATFAGCSPSPTVAIELAGHQVSETTITRYTQGCLELAQPGEKTDVGGLRRAVVSYVGQGLIADQLANKYGFSLSAEDVTQARQIVMRTTEAMPNAQCEEAVIGRIKLAAVMLKAKDLETSDDDADKLETLNDDAAALAPIVNPHYGEWSRKELGVVGTGSLSDESARA